MNVISELAQMRAQVNQWRKNNESIALVPTMGHLHAGHCSLIELAQTRAQHVVVTIFINPLQFNQKEDLERYPRTLSSDLKKLNTMKVDTIFTPADVDLYPQGTELAPRIHVPELSEIFCGEFRPGHFSGVCTIVAKLFNLVCPDIAVFGSKDYQQLLIIRRMTESLNFEINIVAGNTIREPDGLALSSRNALLTPEQRALAPHLYQTLLEIQQGFSISTIEPLENAAKKTLDSLGIQTEYVAIRDAENLRDITQATDNIVVLAAVWLGSVRLIDNILFPRP